MFGGLRGSRPFRLARAWELLNANLVKYARRAILALRWRSSGRNMPSGSTSASNRAMNARRASAVASRESIRE